MESLKINKDIKKQLFSRFIMLYFSLLDIIKSKFEQHSDFKYFYNKNLLLKKTNIKLFIRTWHESISSLYANKVIEGDIQYFFNNVNTIIKTEYLKKYFQYFKQVYVTLDDVLIKKVLNIIQELTKITIIYYNK